MKYLYYIEMFILLFFITLLSIYVYGFVMLFLTFGLLYLLCKLYQFSLIKIGSKIRRPKSLLFNFYGDYTYDTYYEVLDKNCWKLIVKERRYHTIRTINFIEYVIFFFKRVN